MFCGNCGGKLDSNGTCSICTKQNMEQPLVESVPKNTSKNNKKIIIFAGIIGAVLIVILAFILLQKDNDGDNKKRSEALVNLEKNEQLKIKLGEDEFYIGDKISTYKSKNYSYDSKYVDEDAKVNSDSIISQTFYNETGDAQFLGAMYCSAGNECSYDDTILIKANFYQDSKVVINDKLKFGMTYKDVVRLYGEEDGKFYQDSDLLVWTFGEKVK